MSIFSPQNSLEFCYLCVSFYVKCVLSRYLPYKLPLWLNEYEWVATALKNDDINHLKQLWKKAFIDNAENMFKPVSQGGLGKDKMKQLFEFGDYEFDDFIEFKDYLEEEEFLNKALRFVKKE